MPYTPLNADQATLEVVGRTLRVKDASLDAIKLAPAAVQTIDSSGFTIQHNNKPVVLITLWGLMQGYTSDETVAIADGSVDGQKLLLMPVDVGAFCSITIKNNANTSLRGDWTRQFIGASLNLVWDANYSQWIETTRDKGNAVDSGKSAFAVGDSIASGDYSFSAGSYTTASSLYAVAFGYGTTAGGAESLGMGRFGNARLESMFAQATGRFSSTGDAQATRTVVRRNTTNATPTELQIDGSGPRWTLDDEHTYACTVTVCGRQDSGANNFMAKKAVLIRRNAGTVALVGSVANLMTDINPGGWGGVTLTADDTNKSLKVQVTGLASTNIRWTALIEAVEVGY